MKTIFPRALLVTCMALGISLPARSADAPVKPEPAAARQEAPAQAGKDKKRAVTPHNHMRDGKGNWVPDKDARKGSKKSGATGGKASEPGQAGK
jgi:hypothetical protein